MIIWGALLGNNELSVTTAVGIVIFLIIIMELFYFYIGNNNENTAKK